MLEIDTIMCSEMKAKVKDVYLRRLRLLLKSKLNGRNLFLAITSWAVEVIRYSAAFIGWTKNETRELDRHTRRMMSAYHAIHPKSNVQRIYIKRKEGGRGLTSIEECIASELRSLHHYIVNSEETLLTAVAKEEGIFKERVEGKEEYKKRVDAE